MSMTTIDFTPLFRSAIGFDRLASALESAYRSEAGGYPPYNIEVTGQDKYRISMRLVAKELVSSRKTEINPGDWRKDSSGWLGYPPQARNEQSTVMGAGFTDSPDEFASHRQCEMGIERLGVN
jgi:hypothetical protein